MTVPATGDQRTLDLYGRPDPVLHRPRLAAGGCWLLALSCVVPLAMTVTYRIIALRGLPALWAYDHHLYLVDAVAKYVLLVGGAVLLLFADLGRGAINPWPRRLMTGCAIATFALYLAFNLVMNYFRVSLFNVFKASPFRFIYFCTTAFDVMDLATQLAAYYFGLLYALQLARWLSRRPLAVASMWIFGAAILFDTVMKSLSIWRNVHVFLGSSASAPSASFHLFFLLAGWLYLAINVAWVIYFAFLAVRLGQATLPS